MPWNITLLIFFNHLKMSKPFFPGRPYKNRQWANLVHGSEFANTWLRTLGGLPSNLCPSLKVRMGVRERYRPSIISTISYRKMVKCIGKNFEFSDKSISIRTLIKASRKDSYLLCSFLPSYFIDTLLKHLTCWVVTLCLNLSWILAYKLFQGSNCFLFSFLCSVQSIRSVM